MRTQFYKEKPSFPEEEERIYKFWEENDCFQKQLEKTKHLPKYSFYDGPPFATGTPHYGHITAGTIKDIVCRYAAMNGKFVDRRFGWDCHGLPVEYEIDKQFNIRFKEDYEKMGIKQYNQHCRSIVMRYSKEWESTVKRMGRWIDFNRDYKTLDLNFMESVWWVFKQLFDKGLVYRGCKIMPYSTVCTTVLSNFEANQNYKEVSDPSIFVTFPLIEDENVKFLAWTTTPWTLPSNLALAVNPDFDYVKIEDLVRNEVYIMAECRLAEFYKSKDKTPKYKVLEKFKGSVLVGKRYKPLFDYFKERGEDGCFQVLNGTFVTSDAGTGVVHCAPGYGADDYKVCVKAGIIRPDNPVQPLDASGRFGPSVSDFEGKFCKEADTEIKKHLKKNGRMVQEGTIKHSYPFCWRSDSPLIYKAHNSWFIGVTQIKQDLVQNNKKAYWIPAFAQEKRFNNWLENAEDWCFSRNRYWGNPIPLWVSEDFEEIVCVGSIQELKDLTGEQNITDLHREFIDHLTIPSKKGKGVLRRIDEVFDCWFESGSMPYAQVHYPFSTTEEQFKEIFPADFIGEGIDQTRGWFYTLNVLGTALFNSNPYKNLIVNGLVLAQDGKKMSKRLKNYPDPWEIIHEYGADAIRIYLTNSPLVRAETLNFKKEGVKGVIRDIILPWYNAYRFLIQNIERYEMQTNKVFQHVEQTELDNYMDQWIQTAGQNLIFLVRTEMEKYKLYTVVPKLISFLENLTNWYVRLNRLRLKGESGESDWLVALNVLFEVIHKANVLMAPYAPFITEMMYDNMKKCMKEQELSIHYLQIPVRTELSKDQDIEMVVDYMQNIIVNARRLREQKNLSLKQPLQELKVVMKSKALADKLAPVVPYIQDQINVAKVSVSTDLDQYINYSCLPNLQILGKKLGKAMTGVKNEINALNVEQIQTFLKEKTITIQGHVLTEEEILIKGSYKPLNEEHLLLDGQDDFCIILNCLQDDQLKQQGMAREVVNRVQKLRKTAGLQVQDDIAVFISVRGAGLTKAVEDQWENIKTSVKKPLFQGEAYQSQFKSIVSQKFDIDEEELTVNIAWNSWNLKMDKIQEKYPTLTNSVALFFQYYTKNQLDSMLKGNFYKIDGKLTFMLDGQEVVLENGQEFQIQ